MMGFIPKVEGIWAIMQGLLFWLLKGGFKVSSGSVEWYRIIYGTDIDNSEIASPVMLLNS